MFIVLLKFAAAKGRAAELMDAHRQWLARGFDDGVFVLSGTLLPALGGSILASNTTLQEIQHRVSQDPFVVHGVVSPEVIELAANRSIDPLRFLVG